MTDQEWQAYLATLSPELAGLASNLMERINTVLNRDRGRTLDDIQRAERLSDRNAQRLADLVVRLEGYEEQRAADVRAEIDRFAADQLPVARRDELIGVLYNVVTRIEALERGAGVKRAQ